LRLPVALFLCSCTGLVHTQATTTDIHAPGDATPEASALACEAPQVPSPAWYHHAVGYEIFVRSFSDSDGDGIGDLDGLLSRLDYLNDPTGDKDLGVDLLWLMPIAESPSYHGYDVTDYRHVRKEYGGDQAFDRFISEAHKRGIRVVIDLVLNHSSSAHPYFQESASGPDSPRRDWYVWSPVKLDWQRPWGGGQTWYQKNGAWYYALFSKDMPDLNWKTPAVFNEMTDVARAWLGRGVDGFRLDAVRYLVEEGPGAGQADTEKTHEVLRAFRAALNATDALLVGEVWASAQVGAPYFGSSLSDELPMLFDFDLADALVQGIRSARAGLVREALCNRLSLWPAWGAAGVFLTNHDMVRVATALGDLPPEALRLAAALLFGMPGTPWIYYGEEIGMKNGPGDDDRAKRLPMQWDSGPLVGFTTGKPWANPASMDPNVAAQLDDPGSLLALYRSLIQVRRSHEALRIGSTRVLGDESLLVLERATPKETMLLVFNLSGEARGFEPPQGFVPVIPAQAPSGTIEPFGFCYLVASQ